LNFRIAKHAIESKMVQEARADKELLFLDPLLFPWGFFMAKKGDSQMAIDSVGRHG